MGANTNILTSMVNARQLKDLISYIALPRKQNFDSDTSSWFYMQAWGVGDHVIYCLCFPDYFSY